MKEKNNRKPKYFLDGVIKECDPNAPVSLDLTEWLDEPNVGLEVLQKEDDKG